MDAYVLIATRGRSREVLELLEWLEEQTLQPLGVVVIGTSSSDLVDAKRHRFASCGILHIQASDVPGLCIQRNLGCKVIRDLHAHASRGSSYFVAFFDDDFRPAHDWLVACRAIFASSPVTVGVTGHVLADGVRGASLSTADARAYICGQKAAMPHWASGKVQREIDCAYGCNMAFRDCVVHSCRFDENLPLYGWQEDQDFTTQAKAFGRIIYAPECRGVHLGVKSGRTAGLRLGYSQIANPWYLTRKGTMPIGKATKFVVRHLIVNVVRSLRWNRIVDYRGRLHGNLAAVRDLLRGRCHPMRVLELE